MYTTASVTVAAPPDRAFAWLEEADKLGQWIAGLEEVICLKPYVPRGVGTRFLQRVRRGGRVTEYQGEVTSYRPPEELAVRLSSPHLAMDVRFRLASRQDGTLIEQTVRLGPLSRLARLTLPLSGWVLLLRQAGRLGRLKSAMEEAAGPAPRV